MISHIWHWLLEVLQIRRRASTPAELAARYGLEPTDDQRVAMELGHTDLSDDAFREKHNVTAEKLEDLRQRRVVIITGWLAMVEQLRKAHPGALKQRNPTIKIRGQKHDRAYVEDGIEYCLTLTWRQATWQPSDAARYKPGSLVQPYEGEDYDPANAEVVEGGWDHDHCELCWWELDGRDDPVHNTGWVSETDVWVCNECYQRFLRPAM